MALPIIMQTVVVAMATKSFHGKQMVFKTTVNISLKHHEAYIPLLGGANDFSWEEYRKYNI